MTGKYLALKTGIRSMSLDVTVSSYRDGDSAVKSNKHKALGAPTGKSYAAKIMGEESLFILGKHKK